MSPASTSTGRAWRTRWRTARMSTRPPTSAACSLRPVYQERCHLLDWCQTTPWTACKSHQINIMDMKPFLSVHSPTSQHDVWTLTGSTDVAAGTLFLYNIHKWDGSGILTNCFSLLCSLSVFQHTHRSAQPALPYFTVSVLDYVKKNSQRNFESSGWGDLTTGLSCPHSFETCKSYSDVDPFGTHTVLFICPLEHRSKLWAVLCISE